MTEAGRIALQQVIAPFQHTDGLSLLYVANAAQGSLLLLLFVISCFHFVRVSLYVLKPLNDPNTLGGRQLVSHHYA